MSYFVGFHILFDHPAKLDDLVPLLFFLVLDLPGNFERLMVRAENQVFQLFKVQLFHVNLLLSRTLGMIELTTTGFFTFHAGPSPMLPTDGACQFKPFLVNSFDPLDIYLPILLLKVALRNPDRTHVVAPNIMALGLDTQVIARSLEIVVINVILVHLLLFHLVLFPTLDKGASLTVLMVQRVGVPEQSSIDMDVRPFQSPAVHIAQWAWNVTPSRSKSQAEFTDPALSWNFGQAHASLVQTDVAHRAEHYQIVVGVVSICTDLALYVLSLLWVNFLVGQLFLILLDNELFLGMGYSVFFFRTF